MIQHAVHLIWTRYATDVPIIIRMDSGFCDQKLIKSIETLDVGYICSGRFLAEIKRLLEAMPPKNFQRHPGRSNENIWEFFELGDRRGT